MSKVKRDPQELHDTVLGWAVWGLLAFVLAAIVSIWSGDWRWFATAGVVFGVLCLLVIGSDPERKDAP